MYQKLDGIHLRTTTKTPYVLFVSLGFVVHEVSVPRNVTVNTPRDRTKKQRPEVRNVPSDGQWDKLLTLEYKSER